MDEIEDYLKHGIVAQIFQAERNLLIWESVAKQVPNFKKQDGQTQRLFSYIQLSAQTNFVLYTAKLYDTPSKKYPTRCLLDFFDLVCKQTKLPKIENDTSTIALLKHHKLPDNLINAVTNDDGTIFLLAFCKHYLEKYYSKDIQNYIQEVKYMRDKFVAHNENVQSNATLELQTVRNLLQLATEIISIYSRAYFNSIWTHDDRSLISEDAERSTYFITAAFKKLLKK